MYSTREREKQQEDPDERPVKKQSKNIEWSEWLTKASLVCKLTNELSIFFAGKF